MGGPAAEIGLRNVIEDLTPQLGGNLDVNGSVIVSTSNGNIELAPNGSGVVVANSPVDIVEGGLSLKLGADSNANTRTNSTTKWSRLVGAHYTNAEENVLCFQITSGNTNNDIYYGGGTSLANTATRLRFYTAANQTTLTGTERVRIESDGSVQLLADSQLLQFGAAQDYSIQFDGTDAHHITASGNIWLDPGAVVRLGGDGGSTDCLEVSASGDVVAKGTGRTIETEKFKISPIGGMCVKLANRTGANTIAGQLVDADTATDDGVTLAGIAAVDCFGVFLDSGAADDADAWVVVAGIADVALDDNVAAVHGNWMATGAAPGYARTGATPAASPNHFEEIGHCIESVSAGGGGTHILARCVLHFN